MARIRYIKPQFFEDTVLSETSPLARLLYIGLWTLMDRQGVTEYDVKLIRGAVFRYDEKITQKRVQDLITELIAVGRLNQFSCEGKVYLFCPTFTRHQKFHYSESAKYPNPKDTTLTPGLTPVNTEANRLGIGIGMGNGQRVTENTKPGFDFLGFWDRYPKKIAKSDARARFERLILTQEDFNLLLVAVDRFRDHHQTRGTDAQYIPHPASFLGTKEIPRWKDWLDPNNGISEIRAASQIPGIAEILSKQGEVP